MPKIKVEIEVPNECTKSINNFEDLSKVLRAWLDKEDTKRKQAEDKDGKDKS